MEKHEGPDEQEQQREVPFNYLDPSDIKPVVEIEDLLDRIGEVVEIDGAIHGIRQLKSITFLTIRTIRDKLQAVLFGEDGAGLLEGLQEGDFARFTGEVLGNEQAYKGVELAPKSIDKLGGPVEPLPIKLAAKELDLPLDSLLNNRVLTLRHLSERAIFKLQEGIANGFREFLLSQRFTEIHSPKIVEANAEGGANIFEVDYFGRSAFLAQSPQFYKQFMVPVYGRVFEVAPVFRAEKHRTSRHINEYISLDLEMGPIDSFRDVMRMEVACLRYIMDLLGRDYGHELDLLGVELPIVDKIPEISFVEAKELVARNDGGSANPDDLDPLDERAVSEFVKNGTGSDFAFVTGYPRKKRPFYTMPSKDNPELTDSFDLLFRGLEVTTGGQRIHGYDEQVHALIDKGLDPEDFEQFLELHKRGTPPHGGLGLGLERLTMQLLGRDNIREATLFPRDIKRLAP